jgi:hypothetical protein
MLYKTVLAFHQEKIIVEWNDSLYEDVQLGRQSAGLTVG